MQHTLRESITAPVPDRIRALPVNDKGYPVPYFVSRINGEYDFRVVDPLKFRLCVRENRCWICGGALGRHKAFTGGPLLTVNRISAEPPGHLDCAVFAAQVCPFMLLPKSRRREANLPDRLAPTGGAALLRNPGAAVVWVTHAYRTSNGDSGPVFGLEEPSQVLWFAEGKRATREIAQECLQGSVDAWLDTAAGAPPAVAREAARRHTAALAYLPV